MVSTAVQRLHLQPSSVPTTRRLLDLRQVKIFREFFELFNRKYQLNFLCFEERLLS